MLNESRKYDEVAADYPGTRAGKAGTERKRK